MRGGSTAGRSSANPAIADKAEKKQRRGKRARGLAGKAGLTGSGDGARVHGGFHTGAASRRQVVPRQPGRVPDYVPPDVSLTCVPFQQAEGRTGADGT